ncbi:MAG: NADH dehydrogenase [Candidatus Melainabacteria bacterium GWF2_32_7]|nr:MAG: NADH dehydrogenase [Candidatus Melainabacteria bacterium GWF2_32_7]
MSKCGCRCSCESTAKREIPEDLAKIFANYPTKKREYLIPLLQDVQEKYGYLSSDNLLNIAEHLNLPASKVYGVATFYNQFRLIPLGKHIIRVCRGTACHVKGSNQILETFQTELGIQAGETTKDGLFTLETVACLGACSIAPVIVIDEEFYGRLASKEVPAILKKFKK